MQINGIDISRWHARQWAVTIGNHAITNSSEWDRGSPDPFLIGSTIGFKTIKVTLLIKDSSREIMTLDRSNIVAALLEPADITLDGFSHKFRVVLSKDASFEETVNYRQDLWHKLTLELQGYEYGSEISVTGSSSLTVNNPGNIVAPATLEITPVIGSASITVSGLCRDPDSKNDYPVTIRNLVTGKKVVIDGENGLVTQDGALKAGDTDFWEAPILFPGVNKITCNNSNMKMVVKFKPRFM